MEHMRDESKWMKTGLIAAAALILIRILLEQIGAPFLVTSIFGVVWLYFIMPILFAVVARNSSQIRRFGIVMKNVVLFAIYTRLMVAATYVLAHYLNWTASRFSASQGGTVGPEIQSWQKLLFIAIRNGFIWIVMASIIGAVIGAIVLFVRRKSRP